MSGASTKHEHTEEELEAVKKKIIEDYGFEPLESLGYMLTIVLHERNKKREGQETFEYVDPKTGEKIKSSIIKADEAGAEDKFSECVGQVVHMGDEAYKTGKFSGGNTKPWCKLGDWVIVPRHDGTLVDYRGRPTMLVADDRIIGRTPDPVYVSRY